MKFFLHCDTIAPMEILIYRYGSICEPDIMEAFRQLGIDVVEETGQISRKDTSPAETVEAVSRLIKTHRFLFVFSVNFVPAVSETCCLLNVPYVCWTVDVPVMELFSPALENDTNRIFMFDRSQYEFFAPRNPGRIFHLPLATNVSRWNSVLAGARIPKADISFIGSLYNEKDPYSRIKNLPDYAKGYLDALMSSQSLIWGSYFLPGLIDDALLETLSPLVPDMHTPYCEGNKEAQRYLIANSFLGPHIAVNDRQRILSMLSGSFSLELYTLSDASGLPKASLHPKGAKTLTEMPLIFRGSRINMNITMRPIATGLSLRLFDVCGCGGFLMTNYQEELCELYEPGAEVEYYGSDEELMDKAAWYLEHDSEREKIARAGYERTAADHTYLKRISEMIRILNTAS